MDGTAFDRLARTLAGDGTRRRLLGLLGALPLAGRLAATDETETAASRRHAQRQPGDARAQHKDHRDDAQGEACIPTGKRCPSKKPRGKKGKRLGCNKCCQRFVVTDAAGKKACGCQPNGNACTADTASSCCSGVCDGATCQRSADSCTSNSQCGDGAICVDGTCQPCDV